MPYFRNHGYCKMIFNYCFELYHACNFNLINFMKNEEIYFQETTKKYIIKYLMDLHVNVRRAAHFES